MQDCILVGDLGPNPAALAELIWALYRQRSLRVRRAFLLSSTRSRTWLHHEFLAPDGALSDLQATVDPTILPAEALDLRAVVIDGIPSEDEVAPGHAAAWSAARWSLIREATEAAGDQPVIFGLIAGRRRTQTAVLPAMFPLLARPQDLCLDVRVSDPRVEGGTGFFFPEQSRRHLSIQGTAIDARTVEVWLVEVPLPRLRDLLPPAARSDWATALQATQQAIQAVAPPRLCLDLEAGCAHINDTHPLPLTPSQLVWYATLAEARQQGAGLLKVSNLAPLDAVFQRLDERTIWDENLQRSKIFQFLRAGLVDDVAADLMATLRSRTIRAVTSAVAAIPQGHLLVPTKHQEARESLQGIPLEGERIVIRWPTHGKVAVPE